MASYSSINIGLSFWHRGAQEGRAVTLIALQQILYLAQGHSLSLRGAPLISDEVVAMEYGPSYRAVYHAFKHMGNNALKALPRQATDGHLSEETEILHQDTDTQLFLDSVWRVYHRCSDLRLLEFTHVPQGPWKRTVVSEGVGAVVEKDLMRSYFSSLHLSQPHNIVKSTPF